MTRYLSAVLVLLLYGEPAAFAQDKSRSNSQVSAMTDLTAHGCASFHGKPRLKPHASAKDPGCAEHHKGVKAGTDPMSKGNDL